MMGGCTDVLMMVAGNSMRAAIITTTPLPPIANRVATKNKMNINVLITQIANPTSDPKNMYDCQAISMSNLNLTLSVSFPRFYCNVFGCRHNYWHEKFDQL